MKIQKNLIVLILILVVVLLGAMYFNFNNNLQSATSLRSEKMVPVSKDSNSDIDPNVLAQAIANAGDADEISVPTIGGAMKLVTVPKKVFVLGGKSGANYLNDVWSNTDPSTMSWSNLIPTGTTWSPTALYNDALYFNNKIWIFNHNYTGGNGVLSSTTNGTAWTAKTYPAYPAREGFSTVAYGGKMYYMGGCNNITYVKICYNNVYSSTNGTSWVTTNNSPWSSRAFATATSFNGKIWFMGGGAGTGSSTNEVWTYDKNTSTWTQEANALWSPRSHHSATVFKGKLYVIGGIDLAGSNSISNEVWSYNPNTNIWVQEPNAPWSLRKDHSSFIANGKLWVSAGTDGVNELNDMWSSTNGKTWIQEPNANWPARHGQSFVTTPTTF